MKRVAIVVSLVVALAAANPVLVTYLSEFSADSAHPWVELCPLPCWGGIHDTADLTGWRILTSTSACTLSCVLSLYEPFLTVDSEALASGQIGSGTFRLRPDTDFICLSRPGSFYPESVCYPRTPTDLGSSLAPPQHGSASFWSYDGAWEQCYNWYLDSQSTLGDYNANYSTISGSVIVDESLVSISDLTVYARGPHAACCLCETYDTSYYAIGGLGAGKYGLEACLSTPHGLLRGLYPDSVEVGYNQTISDIDIDLRGQGVADHAQPVRSAAPALRVRGAELDVLCPSSADVRLKVFDLTGACRAVLQGGRLEAGVHRFDLASRVRTGVYFIQLTSGRNQTTRKVVITH